MSIAFGLSGITDQADIAELEELGVDSFWAGGHIASPNPSGEAVVGVARLAALTKTTTIGSSILLLPLYRPAIVAKQFAELDRITGGRLVLGVGVGGEFPQEFSAAQVPISERGRRTDEAITLIRKLWTGDTVSHDGPFYPLQDVRIHPSPARLGGPPIVVAGRRPPAMRRAARLGDGWMPYMYSPERYADSMERIRAEAAKIERDLGDFQWLLWTVANVGNDGTEARREAAKHLTGSAEGDFEKMIHRVAVVGNPDEVTARLIEFADIGVRHIILSVLPDRPLKRARRFVEEVIPTVRRHCDDLSTALPGEG